MQKIEVLYIQKDFFLNEKIQKIIKENFENEWNVSYAYDKFDAHKIIEANTLPFDVVIIDDKKEWSDKDIENWKFYAQHLSNNEKCKESIVIIHSKQYLQENIETLKFQSHSIDKQDNELKDSLKNLFEQINTDIHYPQHKIKHTIRRTAKNENFLPEFIGKTKPVGKLKYEIDKCINAVDATSGNTIINETRPIPMLIIGSTGTGKSKLIESIAKHYRDLTSNNKTQIVYCRKSKENFKEKTLDNLDKDRTLSECSFFAFDDIDTLPKEEQKGLAFWIAEKQKKSSKTIIICTASNDDDKIENNLRYHLEKIKIPLLQERKEDIKDIINFFRNDGEKIEERDINQYINSNENKWDNNCYHLCHFAKTFQGNIYKWIKEHTL